MANNGRVVTANLPDDLAQDLDVASARSKRSRSWIIRQAIAEWLAEDRRRHELTLEALESIDRGEFLTHEEVVAHFAELKSQRT